MSEERLTEIETKLAYQEDTIQALNDVVCKQQDQLDQLALKCAALMERFQELTASVQAGDAGEELPPHY